MLDTEGQWSNALASNNIKAIIHWLKKLTVEGEADVGEIIPKFSCWVQRTSEFAKKELLTLCFSRCQGLWMFLDRSSFTRVHMLLQRLRNLLTLAQWGRKQLCSVHLWHGVGVPCMVCRDTYSSSDIKQDCWKREHRTLKQHIWLGRLVQWWGIMGLLPKFPETQEVKRIAQMWKEMDNSHQKACLETAGWKEGEMGRCSSLIQNMVTQLDRQHECIWTSEDCAHPGYPPPNLQALLKLVLMPHIDNMSVQAILMYFILDVANFLQCKDDLLQCFCNAFTIPSSFSQQIRAFWMFDHGHIKASMELLVSPKAMVPMLSWQHRCIIHCLLTRKQPREALRYLQWTRPAVETTEDAKLFADVLIQNSCNCDAWALLKRGQRENDDRSMYSHQDCKGVGLYAEASKYTPSEEDVTTEMTWMKKGMSPCPLSAKLYQGQKVGTVSTKDLVKLVKNAVKDVRKPHPMLREVVWPEHTQQHTPNSRGSFLSTEALHHLTPIPSSMVMTEETQQTAYIADPEEEQPQLPEIQDNVFSSSEDLRSVSGSSFTSSSLLPLLKRDHLYMYESTLALQRISSLLTAGENQSKEEEEEEEQRAHSSADVFLNIPELVLTPDGATEPISFSSLNKDSMVELMLSTDGEGHVKAGVYLEEDIFSVDELSRPSMYENLSDTRSPATLSFHQEDGIPSVIFSFAEEPTTDSILERKLHEQAEPQGCSSQDLSCTPFETTQGLLTDFHQSLVFDQSFPSGSPSLDKNRPSLVQGQPYTYSLVSYMDLNAMQKGDYRDGKQAVKDEPTGWSSLGKVSQGVIRSGRLGSRKGKRVKRT